MDVVLHAHHADVSESLRRDAEAAVLRLAARVRRAVGAVIRFEGDGSERRVEIVLKSPRRPDLFAQAFDRRFESALALAVSRMESQVQRVRRPRRTGIIKGGAGTG